METYIHIPHASSPPIGTHAGPSLLQSAVNDGCILFFIFFCMGNDSWILGECQDPFRGIMHIFRQEMFTCAQSSKLCFVM